MTKQFTAASILLLEERGKLKTDDPVKKYLPDAPAAWDKITIYHLLTHTSGIPSFTGFPEYPDFEKKPATPEELVKRFEDKPLEFEPGSKFKYSNSGGEKYPQFVKENVFLSQGGGRATRICQKQFGSGYAGYPASKRP